MTYSIEPSIQAWAMLHGHLYVPSLNVHEAVTVNGHLYLLHPPLAAVVMMPFIALFGLGAAPLLQPIVSIGLGIISVLLAGRLVRWNPWLTLFYAFGTTLTWEATRGSSWDMILVLSTIPTLLALTELTTCRRPWLVGLWSGMACLARYDLALACPIYLVLLLLPPSTWLGVMPASDTGPIGR